jgi:hypothetical protein
MKGITICDDVFKEMERVIKQAIKETASAISKRPERGQGKKQAASK